MKTFKQYVKEDAKSDQAFRKEANRVWTKIKAALDRGAAKDFKILADTILYVNMGKLINDEKYKNLELQFGRKNKKYGGYHRRSSLKREPQTITILSISPEIKALVGLPEKSIKAVLIYAMNFSAAKTFVHEFIHYKDAERYKDPTHGLAGTAKFMNNNKWQVYYNSAQEMNAHYQAAVADLEKWYSGQYEDIVRRMGQSLNMPHQDFDINWAIKKLDHIKKYINDKKYSYSTAFDYIAKDKNFYKYLTPENKKKIQGRIYQYVDRILMPKMKALKPKLEKVIIRYKKMQDNLK